MSISPAAKKALKIGAVCFLSYLAVYASRNTLGAVTPKLTEDGSFSVEGVGTLSSLFFITYAVGQLINGAIGDRIKAKYMMSIGLIVAGIGNALFPVLVDTPLAVYITYAVTGFALSMIYGPMTKVVSENTEPLYATRCSLGYTVASLIGSPLAGVFATLFVWQGVFATSSAILLVMGIVCFLVFSILERKKVVEYGKYQKPPSQGVGGSIQLLLRNQIVKFIFVAMITGVVRTTVVFWLPTYIAQYLGYTAEQASLIFTVSTVVISLAPFLSIFVYERLKQNMNLVILLSFIASSVCFLVVYLFCHPVLNVVMIVLAITLSECASTMMFSRYCTSLYATGMVSGVAGFLDFVSYIAAALASTLFANAVSQIGWGNLILICFGLMIFGVVIALPFKRILHKKASSMQDL